MNILIDCRQQQHALLFNKGLVQSFITLQNEKSGVKVFAVVRKLTKKAPGIQFMRVPFSFNITRWLSDWWLRRQCVKLNAVCVTFDIYQSIKDVPQLVFAYQLPAIGTRFKLPATGVLRIIVADEKARRSIAGYVPGVSTDIVLWHPLNTTLLTPIAWAEKQSMLTTYAGGREFFISRISFQTDKYLLLLLKAFSIFKRRQQSGMQMLLVAPPDAAGLDMIGTYKFRNDVHIISEEQEAAILPAAYACVWWSEEKDYVLGDALFRLGVPVIRCGTTAAGDFAEGAALYADETETALAEQLKTTYKDELLRSELIAKGKQKAAGYPQDNIQKLYQLLSFEQSQSHN